MFILAVASMCVRAALTPVDLTCEYRANPLGIDETQPRLSWKFSQPAAATGLYQAAYHLRVGRTAGSNELWDTGWVYTNRSVHIEYGGVPLQYGDLCFWQVRCVDSTGTTSEWSTMAYWLMGPLGTQDWEGVWIGAPHTVTRTDTDLHGRTRALVDANDIEFRDGEKVVRGYQPAADVPVVAEPWLRKTFVLTAIPVRVYAYVASLGYHELYVNGTKAHDTVLVPAISDYTQRVRYVTYDLTPRLQVGSNVFAFWLGDGWAQYIYFNQSAWPLVLAQFDLVYDGGQAARIVTDGTWKHHGSPVRYRGQWFFMHFGGERWQAADDVPGWGTVGFDDSGWASAGQYSVRMRVTAQQCRDNRIIESYPAVSVVQRYGGAYRADMGKNFTGFLSLALQGTPGAQVTIRTSERLSETTSHDQYSYYVLGPQGTGTFYNKFNYSSGRWINFEGVGAQPGTNDIWAHVVRTDFPDAGTFVCSDELLNRIHATVRRTFDCLSLGGYIVDCPHRERMGYGGDAHATMETGLLNYDLGAFYTKWMEDWRDSQYENGDQPHTSPTYWGGGGPAWGGFCVTLPWEFYKTYGDLRMLDRMYDTMTNWLAFLESHTSGNILQQYGGQWDFLGDWAWPNQPGGTGYDTPEAKFFNNCYYIYNLQIVTEIAALLGKGSDAATYAARAAAMQNAVHNAFFNPAQNTYVNGMSLFLAFPLLVGVTPAPLRAAVEQELEDRILVDNGGHLDTGIPGTYILIEALRALGRDDLMYAVTSKTDFPGWGDMLRQGASVFWERWEGSGSLLHSSYLSVGAWFFNAIAGINHDLAQPGYEHIVIKPVPVGNLTWAAGSYESIRGTISSAWQIADWHITLDTHIPPNTTASVYVPTNRAGDAVVHEVGSGDHSFTHVFGEVPEAATAGAACCALLLAARSRCNQQSVSCSQ